MVPRWRCISHGKQLFDSHSRTLQGSFLLNEPPYANLCFSPEKFYTKIFRKCLAFVKSFQVPFAEFFSHVMTNAKAITRATIIRGINCKRLGRLTINHSCKGCGWHKIRKQQVVYEIRGVAFCCHWRGCHTSLLALTWTHYQDRYT